MRRALAKPGDENDAAEPIVRGSGNPSVDRGDPAAAERQAQLRPARIRVVTA